MWCAFIRSERAAIRWIFGHLIVYVCCETQERYDLCCTVFLLLLFGFMRSLGFYFDCAMAFIFHLIHFTFSRSDFAHSHRHSLHFGGGDGGVCVCIRREQERKRKALVFVLIPLCYCIFAVIIFFDYYILLFLDWIYVCIAHIFAVSLSCMVVVVLVFFSTLL